MNLRLSGLKMPWRNDIKPLLILIGPTAVGKTDTAILLARQLDAEIISVDSRYFYRGMDIGTAKPSQAEMGGIPHHLIDVANPDERWSLTIFQEAAKRHIEEIYARGRLPMLVGGTGQFIRAVMDDWQPPEQAPDERMRTVLETWGRQIGPAEIHRRLALIDPQAAARIDANNLRRTVRALEVIFKTGVRFSEQRRQNPSPYTCLQIGLIRSREELYARIDERIDLMLKNGLIEEVRGLMEAGYSLSLPSMSAIGYREVGQYIRGEITLEEAAIQMKRLTRQFVRRQANWFIENDPDIHWYEANNLPIDEIVQLARERLGYHE